MGKPVNHYANAIIQDHEEAPVYQHQHPPQPATSSKREEHDPEGSQELLPAKVTVEPQTTSSSKVSSPQRGRRKPGEGGGQTSIFSVIDEDLHRKTRARMVMNGESWETLLKRLLTRYVEETPL